MLQGVAGQDSTLDHLPIHTSDLAAREIERGKTPNTRGIKRRSTLYLIDIEVLGQTTTIVCDIPVVFSYLILILIEVHVALQIVIDSRYLIARPAIIAISKGIHSVLPDDGIASIELVLEGRNLIPDRDLREILLCNALREGEGECDLAIRTGGT